MSVYRGFGIKNNFVVSRTASTILSERIFLGLGLVFGLVVFGAIAEAEEYAVTAEGCFTLDAQLVEVSCCSQTNNRLLLDSQSTACSCSAEHSIVKNMCQCSGSNFSFAGKCRTQKELNQFEESDTQVTLLNRPFYLWLDYLSDRPQDSLNSQSGEYLVSDEKGQRTLNASSASFQYQKLKNGGFQLSVFVDGMLANRKLGRITFSNAIVEDLGHMISPCIPGPELDFKNLKYVRVDEIDFNLKANATNTDLTKNSYSLSSLTSVLNQFSDTHEVSNTHEVSGSQIESQNCLSLERQKYGYQ